MRHTTTGRLRNLAVLETLIFAFPSLVKSALVLPLILVEVHHLLIGNTVGHNMHNRCQCQVDIASPHSSKITSKTPRSIPAEHHSKGPFDIRSMNHNHIQGCQNSSTPFLRSCKRLLPHSTRPKCTQHRSMHKLRFHLA
mmetsp:Transcript_41456/g.79427  ORF Transcript_41456/g.79427 Transcript_41456/m.79427 type:complete len:139 (-) Transcript_41456:132-548(-)